MSRTARGNSRRRNSLLASSSLLATTLMVGLGGVAVNTLTPSLALAAVLCAGGNPGAIDYVCTISGAGGNDPIVFNNETDFLTGTSTGPVTVTDTTLDYGLAMDAATTITIVGPGDGLAITNTTGNTTTTTPSSSTIGGTINVDTGKGIVFTSTTGDFTGSISATITSANNGIDFSSTSGAIDLTTSGAISSSGGSGIVIKTTDDITLATSGAVTGGGGDGIHLIVSNVNTSTGSISLTTSAAVTGGGNGVYLFSDFGSINATLGGTVTGAAGDGVRVNTLGGLNLATNGAVSGGSQGISVISWASNPTVINANADVTGGFGGIVVNLTNNVFGPATSDVTINVNNAGTDINGNAGAGISVKSGFGGDVTVTSDAGATITGTDGIVIKTTGGSGATTVVADGAITGTLGDGIQAITAGLGPITVDYGTGAGASPTLTAALIGIEAKNNNPLSGSDVIVTVGNAVGPTTINAGETGVLARTNGTGDAKIVLGNNVTIDPDDYGLKSFSALGQASVVTGSGATIIVDDAIIPGDDFTNIGIGAYSGAVADPGVGIPAVEVLVGANNTITVEDTSDGTVFGTGIQAYALGVGTGSVVIDIQDGLDLSVLGGAGGVGIDALSNGGDITVTAGTGAILITDAAAPAGSAMGMFIGPAGAGDISVTSALNIDVNNSFGGSIGIWGAGQGGSVSIVNSGDIISRNGVGILATNSAASTGDVSVHILGGTAADNVSVVGINGNGITATSAGSGDVTVLTDLYSDIEADDLGFDDINAISSGTGNVTVTTFGELSAIGWAGDSAVDAEITNAASTGDVTVNVENFSWANTGPGILATNAGLGAVTVNLGDQARAWIAMRGDSTGDGINASITNALSTSDVNVTLGEPTGVNTGTVLSYGRGIVASNAGTGDVNVTINSGSSVFGLGDATHAVIDLTTSVGSTATINNSGLIKSDSATPAAYGSLAVLAAGGALVVNNTATGVLDGRIDASASTNAIITNAGVWHTTGTSTLTAGADTITNTATGSILTNAGGAATTIDFGAGVDQLTNAGKIVVGEAPQGAATLTLANLEAFGNSGTIVFGGSTLASDGVANDRLITGAVFSGSGASLLRMDANLWSDTQADCTVLTAADCLQVASTTGSTSILINDTNTHALGAYNPTGIAIVKGSSSALHFALNSGSEWFNIGGTNQFGGATNVLDKPGLFFYDLAYDAATHTERLIGVPKATVFEFAALGGASSDLWYMTTQSWFDRQADLRETVAGRPAGGAPGVWLKVTGDWTRRTGDPHSLTLFDKTYIFNIRYDQDTAALIGGIDFLNVTGADSAWVLGVQAGYVDSNVRFKASADRADIKGSTLGVYGSYVSGGLFVDAIVNANFFNVDMNLPLGTTSPTPWTTSDDDRSWGGQIEAGYAIPIGAASFFEPVASLAYVRTDLDDLLVPGGSVEFNDMDSFRGSLGARIGTTASYQYYKIRLALEGRVWDEFDGKNSTNLVVSGGPDFPVIDEIDGVFGEIKGEANIFAVGNNLSAFLNGGVKWKTHYQSSTVSLGMRYQW